MDGKSGEKQQEGRADQSEPDDLRGDGEESEARRRRQRQGAGAGAAEEKIEPGYDGGGRSPPNQDTATEKEQGHHHQGQCLADDVARRLDLDLLRRAVGIDDVEAAGQSFGCQHLRKAGAAEHGLTFAKSAGPGAAVGEKVMDDSVLAVNGDGYSRVDGSAQRGEKARGDTNGECQTPNGQEQKLNAAHLGAELRNEFDEATETIEFFENGPRLGEKDARVGPGDGRRAGALDLADVEVGG